MDAEAATRYLRFVSERHHVWEARQLGRAQPWTTDPILASRKFTNVFRVLDPGSQFIVEVLRDTDTPEEALYRAFLYRYSNLPASWQEVNELTGRWPSLSDSLDTLDIWQARAARGEKVFSGAYVILPQPNRAGDKVEQAVQLAARLFTSGVAAEFLRFPSRDAQAQRFTTLRQLYGVGDFMAMQVLTDWGYSPFGDDTEDEFVVAGPGARKGCAVLAPGQDPGPVMTWAHEQVGQLVDLYGRPPSMMDVQNTFCEFFKYERFRARGADLHAVYNPAHPGRQPEPVLPNHWKAQL